MHMWCAFSRNNAQPVGVRDEASAWPAQRENYLSDAERISLREPEHLAKGALLEPDLHVEQRKGFFIRHPDT